MAWHSGSASGPVQSFDPNIRRIDYSMPLGRRVLDFAQRGGEGKGPAAQARRGRVRLHDARWRCSRWR